MARVGIEEKLGGQRKYHTRSNLNMNRVGEIIFGKMIPFQF